MSIQQLNEHPLNQAALQRLEKEREGSMSDLMHLLTLAHAGLSRADPQGDVDPFSPESKVLGDWGQTRNLQRLALGHLDGAVETDEVMELPLPELAERVIGTLKGASGS